jgi:hypothetical protein
MFVKEIINSALYILLIVTSLFRELIEEIRCGYFIEELFTQQILSDCLRRVIQ